MVKVLVTGASGLLGRAVFTAFKAAGHDVTGTAFSRASGDLIKLDLHDEEAVKKAFAELKPEVVVHCAAERKPDAVEANPEAAIKLNVAVPALLSTLSVSPANPFFLIYISTDYVFDGHAPAGGYTPLDDPAPTNAYGDSKLRGEDKILLGLKDGCKGCVIRVPVLYGEAHSNSESAVNVLLDATRKAAKGEKVKMDNWAFRFPTNVSDIARVLVELSEKSQTQEMPAILHFSAQQEFTKYTIALLFASLHTPPLEVEQNLIRVDDGPKEGETVRPKDCHLSNAEIEKLGIDTTTVDFASWFREYIARA